MAENWRVVENRERGRTLSEGSEASMKAYVEKHFPRPHIEPGSVSSELQADVHVVGPAGQRAHYLGDESGWADPNESADDSDTEGED